MTPERLAHLRMHHRDCNIGIDPSSDTYCETKHFLDEIDRLTAEAAFCKGEWLAELAAAEKAINERDEAIAWGLDQAALRSATHRRGTPIPDTPPPWEHQ